MTPKSPDNGFQLFQSHLDQILAPEHRLIRLAKRIDWSRIETELEPCYSPDLGRPGCSTRLNR
ncbi:MAG: hypothetical protein JXA82_03490 [Sedimentisphaerales bacterium]|nr:hypothetical protein [Sedimentisphaerales bacterium]